MYLFIGIPRDLGSMVCTHVYQYIYIYLYIYMLELVSNCLQLDMSPFPFGDVPFLELPDFGLVERTANRKHPLSMELLRQTMCVCGASEPP